eukprot:GFUD01037022.1.p1 GENE.GFUD01037022.1~~GFUD01037022.1.p1  ORF type:complete len:627 (+),score=181.38 GFUD01037022.1:64-1944(+)
MELQDRLDLMKVSTISKKLEKLMESADKFEPLISAEVGKLGAKASFENSNNEDSLESEMVVCVRVRPRLSHELSSNYMLSTFTSNPEVLVVEPSFRRSFHIGDGGKLPGDMPRLTPNKFSVDLAFGEEDDNNVVYKAVAQPLIDLAIQGGVSTIFAYGQTGSGKTFTISGLIDKMAVDLFDKKDDDSKDGIKLHISYIQLLGNAASDLLNDNMKVDILEDKFGKVKIVGAREEEINNADEFLKLTDVAAEHRKTSTTMKNDTSSRSHSICRIRVENTVFRQAEDGFLFIIDLAGAENAADSQFHDKSRIKETKEINKSLMCLKECIRNRAKSAMEPHTFVHIPFRQSKLSLLLKDAFELESFRLCKTVVFANIAPTLADNAMTLNTLRYVAPIKMGVKNMTKIIPDPKSPASWSNEKLVEWVKKASNGKIDPLTLCPWESGKQLLSLPEAEILKRITVNNPKLSEARAKDFYTRLWKLLVEARTKERKTKLKKQTGSKYDDTEIKNNTAEEEERIANNNTLPEIELKIMTATAIADKDFIEKVRKLEEVEEVRLFTVNLSEEERWQRFYIQIKPSTYESIRSYESLSIFRTIGVKVLFADFRDVRSDDSKFETSSSWTVDDQKLQL